MSSRSRILMAAALAALVATGCKKSEPSSAPKPAEPAAAASDAAAGEGERGPARPADVVLASEQTGERDTGDLDAVQKRGVLRVLVAGTGESFLPRQGMPSSYDRVLARDLAKALGVEARFVLVGGYDQLLPALLEGQGDLIAAQLTVTKDREQKVAFTHVLRSVEEILVARKGAPDAPKKVEDLAGRKVVVASSAHAESLEALKEKAPGLEVVIDQAHLDAEELVYRVTQGELPLTVVDAHVLAAIEAYNDQVQRQFPVGHDRRIAWAVRKDNPKLKAKVDAFLVEKALTAHAKRLSTGDLEEIRERGRLRVLTRNNPVTYFLHRGLQQGFDYELAKMAAEQLGVRLEMVVPPSRDLLIPWLLEGRGDVIAASLTVTPERGEKVAFSRPYLFVEEVVVGKAGGPKIEKLEDLAGKEIHVRPTSSYRHTLEQVKKRVPGLKIVEAPEEQETEELVARVAAGEIPYTVADSHIVKVELTYRDDIEAVITLAQGEDGAPKAWDDLTAGGKQIAFAVRPGNPKLKEWFDGFVKKTYRGLEYNMARKRYFENPRRIAQVKTERVGASGKLSPYDDLIQRYASRYGLDWRLMAALAYQESRFDPTVKSWVGALGLFQLMPTTAKEMGFEKPEKPEQGAHAGIKYVSYLVGRFDPKLPLQQRVRFAMAAYNAGYGHVEDARRLAAAQGLDPNKWFGNVEKAMLMLEKPKFYSKARYGYVRGTEPVNYVSQIQNRYDNWTKLVK